MKNTADAAPRITSTQAPTVAPTVTYKPADEV